MYQQKHLQNRNRLFQKIITAKEHDFKTEVKTMKMKKLLVGHTESDKYFVRIRSTKPLPEARAYPVLPMDKSECIIRLQRLAKHYAHLPILHDGLCGTSDTHQLCIKLIIWNSDSDEAYCWKR